MLPAMGCGIADGSGSSSSKHNKDALWTFSTVDDDSDLEDDQQQPQSVTSGHDGISITAPHHTYNHSQSSEENQSTSTNIRPLGPDSELPTESNQQSQMQPLGSQSKSNRCYDGTDHDGMPLCGVWQPPAHSSNDFERMEAGPDY